MLDISSNDPLTVQFFVSLTGYSTPMPSHTTQRRAPRGVVTDKPVPVRFMPEERTEFQRMAAADDRSLAAFTRLMALRGLADFKRKEEGVTTPPSN